MPTKPSACVQDHFASLTDPRRRKVTYPLVNIVTIAICAVICGADDFVAIAKFGRVKQKWLSRFLNLKDAWGQKTEPTSKRLENTDFTLARSMNLR